MQSPQLDGEDPTRRLGRAFAIAARIAALPPHLHDAAIRSACGSDAALQEEVRDALRAQAGAGKARTRSDGEPAPRTFGRYEIHECIGRGSMGVVYRATQTDTGRIVALKLLHPGEATDALLARFRREVVLLARLSHRGIVQILDAGREATPRGQEPFLAMELVEGPGLLDGARAARLDIRDRVRLLVQLCRAIGHAHRRGVIHRDLKPDNIRLEHENGAFSPRVLDFGVATASTGQGAESTLARHVVGTLGYIAPEQINGEVDVRCDVYSLGAIAFELLTGARAIDVRGLGVLRAIAHIRDTDAAPASHHEPRLRGDLDAVLARALARSPDDRYPSADEFGNDLERWLQDRPVEARPPTPWYLLSRFVRRQRAMSMLAALLVASVLLGGWFAVSQSAQAHAANRDLVTVLAATAAELSEGPTDRQRPRELPGHLKNAVADLVERFPDDLGVRDVQAAFLQVESTFARAQGQLQRARQLREELVAVRRLIHETAPSSTSRRDLAIAEVLLGDAHKEIAENLQADFGEARRWYLTAHPRFLQATANSPEDRRANDDLAHSFLRLAAIELKERQLAAAESLLTKAEILVRLLVSEFGDSSHTHEVLREMLGLTGLLAELHGNGSQRCAIVERMLDHIQTVHRLDPENLHATEFLLATARACALAALDAGQADRARQFLRIAEEAAAEFARRDPTNVQALEERAQVEWLWGRIALDAADPATALRHVALATRLALEMRIADDQTRMFARLLEIAAIGQVALHDLDAAATPLGDEARAAVQLALYPLQDAAERFPQCRELRDCCVRLQNRLGR